MDLDVLRKDGGESDNILCVTTAHPHGVADTTTATNKVQLERKMGLISCVGMIVGTMIGSGIFVSTKDVLERSGSVGVSLIVWLSCGLISLFGGLCYIELGCVVPKSGGEYTYLLEAYGPLHRFFGPLPAYLYSYSRTLATGPSGFAVISLSFATYVAQPFYPTGEMPWWLPKAVAAGCVCALIFLTSNGIGWQGLNDSVTAVIISVINSASVRLSTLIQNTFTAVKVIALAVIIVAGLIRLGQGSTANLASPFTPFGNGGHTAAGIASAFYSGLWSYEGW
ncbi:hypothetical protein RvY_06861 [Ramazzottius varieornatus]|uniref:Amino acid permease/ SLC12A domain-containing protein n=1 Tax=Ramazzottius varieornatus TaxID=947166 RepID=A0A1D1V8Q3_RAMVA|nr:hypothetical protein RvY_06861 [Ramazzottius varieornatus]